MLRELPRVLLAPGTESGVAADPVLDVVEALPVAGDDQRPALRRRRQRGVELGEGALLVVLDCHGYDLLELSVVRMHSVCFVKLKLKSVYMECTYEI